MTLAGEHDQRSGLRRSERVEVNHGAGRRSSSRIALDLRALDRATPNHQIGPHQDFGGVRDKLFVDLLQLPTSVSGTLMSEEFS